MENEEELKVVSTEIEPTEEELSGPISADTTSRIETMDHNPDSIAPARAPQLEGMARFVNELGATSRFASAEEMRRAFNERLHGTSLEEAIYNLSLAEGENREARVREILTRSDLTPMERLSIAKQVEKDAELPDTNMLQRRWLGNQAEAGRELDDEGEAAFQESMDYVMGLPRLARPEVAPEANLTPEEMRSAYYTLLDMSVQDADARDGSITLDPSLHGMKERGKFLMQLAPNLLPFQQAIPVARIMKRLNDLTGETNMSPGGAAFLSGTAIRVMREKVESLPVEKKMKFLGEVLKILNPNGELLHYENAMQSSYLLNELFFKDITGQDRIPVATDEQNKEYFAAKTRAEEAARKGRLAREGGDDAAYRAYNREAALEERKALNIATSAGGRMWDDMNRVTFSQWLDDLAVLDYVGLGGLATATIKAGSKGGMGILRQLSRVNPKGAHKLALEALKDPRKRAELGKLLPEDVAETFLPAAMKDAEEAGINGMGELQASYKQMQEEVARTRIEGSGITPKMRSEFRKELESILGKTAKAELHYDKSRFTETEKGVDYLVRYGRTASQPFAQVGTARKALADMPPHARVVQLDPKTGKYQVVKDSTPNTKRGQYFVAYDDSRIYDSSKSVWDEAVFDREQVRDPSFLKSSVLPTARAWNWFMPTDSMFGPGITGEIVDNTLRAPVIQRMHMDLIKTLTSLPPKDQYVVSALLKQGEEMGRTFRASDIKTMYPGASDDVVTSYYEARALSDNMYELANDQQRAEWFRNGIKQVRSGGEDLGFGKALPTANDAVADIKSGYQTLHVYDPNTKTFAPYTRAEIDNLYGKGKSLIRMEDLIEGPGMQEATHVLGGKGVDLRQLPRKVLKKRAGYYTHIFQGNYVVYGTSKAGNKIALGIARSLGDAKAGVERYQKIMARLGDKAPFDPKTVSYRFDRSLRDPMVATKEASDPIFGATQKVYGQRSERMLDNLSKSYGDHMVDPVEGLMRGMELVGHSVTKGNLIRHMEQRLMNTLRVMEKESGKRIIRDPTKMVKTADDIEYHPEIAKDHRKVLAYMKQIDMIRHIPDESERAVSAGLTMSAEILDDIAGKILKIPLPGSKSIAADIDRLGEMLATRASKGFDPVRVLTEIAHRYYIASNPLQQFALQASQALMLSGVAPKQLPTAIAQSTPIMSLLYGKLYNAPAEVYEKVLKLTSKATGYKPDELRQLVGALERSGLIDSVSMHSQISTAARAQAFSRQLASASSLNQNVAGRMTMDGLRKLDEATFGKLSEYGFEMGEQYNRVITFMSLYRRDKAKGIANLNSPSYLRGLSNEVNSLVGSMLRETSMGYQRGWLKAAFQFVAFQHKMAALMLTNKTLTPAQKRGIAMSQFLLFGSRGAAHYDLARRSIDHFIEGYEAENPDEKSSIVQAYRHPLTQQALDGFVFDTGVNELLRVASGEDTPDFAWRERIAPGGGSEFVAKTFADMIHNPTEKVFGLTGKLIHPRDVFDIANSNYPRHGSKLASLFDHMRRVTLAQAQDMDDVPIEERASMLAKEGLAATFSGYDKYLALAAAQRLGGYVTDTGNIVSSSGSDMESMLGLMLGVNTEDREAYYNLTDRMYSDIRNNPKKQKEALDLVADQMFKRQVDEVFKYNEVGIDDLEQIEGRMQREQAFLLSFLEPREQAYVSAKLQEKLKELITHKRDTAQETFYRNLTRELDDTGMLNEDALRLGVYLKHSPLFKTHPQLQSDLEQKLREMTEYEDK